MPRSARALDPGSARREWAAVADVLAHTPRDPLPADLLARMKGRWVISTLRAFSVPAERLRALHAAGARVAYGTDLGNENSAPGIDAGELQQLASAGVDFLAAATSSAAALLGLPGVGSLEVGASASLLAVRSLASDDLAHPEWVVIAGRRPA